MADQTRDPFGARTTVDLPEGSTSFYRLSRLEDEGAAEAAAGFLVTRLGALAQRGASPGKRSVPASRARR